MDTEQLFHSIRRRYPEFEGQVAIVTGSSRGIGKGIALRLAREGMKLVIHGVDKAEVAHTVKEFEALGVEVLGVANNFSQEDSVAELFDKAMQHFGKLDLLVNNAADLRRRVFVSDHTELLDYQIAVNMRAPYLCSWQAANIMQKEQRGNIINISSVGGIRAHLPGLPYDMAKGGMDMITKALAIELARDGIRVNSVAPGAIRTEKTPPPEHEKIQAVIERIPIPRFGLALDIGAAVAFLASDDASYITGHIMYVDGGITAQLSPPGQPI